MYTVVCLCIFAITSTCLDFECLGLDEYFIVRQGSNIQAHTMYELFQTLTLREPEPFIPA